MDNPFTATTSAGLIGQGCELIAGQLREVVRTSGRRVDVTKAELEGMATTLELMAHSARNLHRHEVRDA